MSDLRFTILRFGSGQVYDLRFRIKSLRFTFHVSRFTRYAILSVVLVGIIILSFWWLLSPRDDGALAEIQRRGALRVGLDASFPPFESINGQGEIVGLDVDIAQAIAKELGVELELVNIGFDGLYDALLARRIDIIISGLPYDPRWTQDVAYTRNYFNAGQVLITRADNKSINSVEELSGRTVAIEWGSQADMEGRHLAKKMPTVELLRYATAAEAIQAALDGEADSAIVDAVSGVRAFPRGLKIITYLTDEWYAAAVHLDSQALLEAVDQALSQLEEGGEMAEMQAKWLHGP